MTFGGVRRARAAEALAGEIVHFGPRVSENANLIMGALKTGAHDDLVIALGLSVLDDPTLGSVRLGRAL